MDRISDDEDFVFTFDPAWVGDADRPTLGQLFVDRMPDEIATSGLPCWFANLLPQGPSRRLLQRWAGLDVQADDGFDLLGAIGGDLPGAVTLEPASPRVQGTGGYRRSEAGRPAAPGFSLAGVQCKLSVREGERGLVIPAWGEVGDVIAKFHDPAHPGLPRLEAATTEWAQRAGIHAHTFRLGSVTELPALPEGLATGDGRVLLVNRFDRADSARIHAEDFAQILDRPPGFPAQYAGSYEMVAAALGQLVPPEWLEADACEYVSRLAFMVVCGNGDAHLKNWGVVYSGRTVPRLSPAYDLVSTIAMIDGDTLALSFGGRREFGAVGSQAFKQLGVRLGVAEGVALRWAVTAWDRALDAWHRERAHLPLSAAERAKIDAHIARLPAIGVSN